MVKKITALVFMLAFVAQTFSAPFVLLDYYTNTGAYAKNCVNKARPKMHCNGKCQLMKKMKEEEKKDQENAGQRSGAKLEILSCNSSFATIDNIEFQIIPSAKNAAPCHLFINNRSFGFFHPPQLA